MIDSEIGKTMCDMTTICLHHSEAKCLKKVIKIFPGKFVPPPFLELGIR